MTHLYYIYLLISEFTQSILMKSIWNRDSILAMQDTVVIPAFKLLRI